MLDRLAYGLCWAMLILGLVVVALMALPFLFLMALVLIPILVVFGL